MPAPEAPERPKQSQSSSAPKLKPFTLEFDNGGNGTMILPVNTMRVRMAWRRENFFNKIDRLGRPSAKSMGKLEAMPDIPGMLLHVRPHATKAGWIACKITDPLKDDPELLERVSSVLQHASVIGSDAKRKPAPEISFDFDPDMAKTFLIALKELVDQEWAEAINGTTFPSAQEIDALPGEELYDPANPFRSKRLYVKDVMAGAGMGQN